MEAAMGIAYRCDGTAGLSVSVWEGTITPDEARQHIANLAADPDWGACRFVVTDLSRVSQAARPTPERMTELAEVFLRQLARKTAIVKWAFVADRELAQAATLEAHMAHEVRRMLVFDSLEPACKWLGVGIGDVQEIVTELCKELGIPA